MIVLGIETSCDETATAVVEDGRKVRSQFICSQIAQHQPFGGVVPEIAARAHVEVLPSLIEQAMSEADVDWDQLDAIAVTAGPGLSSSLLVGVTAAKSLALRLNKPLIPVNHLEAHLYAVLLGEDVPPADEIFPAIGLLVSGGHSCLVKMNNPRSFNLLGQTLDDAAGEALDKGACLLKLGYPGGPVIEKAALHGNPHFVRFPRGLAAGDPTATSGTLPRAYCFSFSGIKTALRYYLEDNPTTFTNGKLNDVAASYQEAIVDALISRTKKVLEKEHVRCLACGGGVARNKLLRKRLAELAESHKLRLRIAAPDFCTDNAAMVAGIACADGILQPAVSPLTLDVSPQLRLTR